MYKYSFEFKKKVVLAYLNGEGSFQTIANKYEVPSWGNVKKWVRSYENLEMMVLKDQEKELSILLNKS